MRNTTRSCFRLECGASLEQALVADVAPQAAEVEQVAAAVQQVPRVPVQQALLVVALARALVVQVQAAPELEQLRQEELQAQAQLVAVDGRVAAVVVVHRPSSPKMHTFSAAAFRLT